MDDLRARAEAAVEMIDATAGSRADDVEIIHDALCDAVEAELEACCKLDVKPLPDSPPETENEYWNGFWDGRDALRQSIRRRTRQWMTAG